MHPNALQIRAGTSTTVPKKPTRGPTTQLVEFVDEPPLIGVIGIVGLGIVVRRGRQVLQDQGARRILADKSIVMQQRQQQQCSEVDFEAEPRILSHNCAERCVPCKQCPDAGWCCGCPTTQVPSCVESCTTESSFLPYHRTVYACCLAVRHFAILSPLRAGHRWLSPTCPAALTGAPSSRVSTL